MATITISKNLAEKGNLVAISKDEYRAFAKWKKTVKIRLEDGWFWTPEWQKKEAEVDAAIRAGMVSGPFSNHKDLISALRPKR